MKRRANLVLAGAAAGVLALAVTAWAQNLTVTGKIGIGTTAPAEKRSVAGTIESTSGGVKFPDGTTQAMAVSATDMALLSMGVAQSAGTARLFSTNVADSFVNLTYV